MFVPLHFLHLRYFSWEKGSNNLTCEFQIISQKRLNLCSNLPRQQSLPSKIKDLNMNSSAMIWAAPHSFTFTALYSYCTVSLVCFYVSKEFLHLSNKDKDTRLHSQIWCMSIYTFSKVDDYNIQMSQFNPCQSQFPVCLTLNCLLSLAAHFSHTALFCPHTDQMISAPSRWTDRTLTLQDTLHTSSTVSQKKEFSDCPWCLDYPLYLWLIFECAYLVLR